MKFIKSISLILAIILSIAVYSYSDSFTKNAYCDTEVFFSPDGHIKGRLIKAIDNSKYSIDIAIFDFTSKDLKSALEKAKKRDVVIRIITDNRQSKGKHSVIQTLIEEDFDVRIVHGKRRGIMHNKFAIFDRSLLFTGSYNWTENAEYFNYENAIFIYDFDIIKKYQKEFNKIWNQSIIEIPIKTIKNILKETSF